MTKKLEKLILYFLKQGYAIRTNTNIEKNSLGRKKIIDVQIKTKLKWLTHTPLCLSLKFLIKKFGLSKVTSELKFNKVE